MGEKPIRGVQPTPIDKECPMDQQPPVQRVIAPNQGKPWTPEDRDQLKHLFLHGFDLKALCERVGRSPYGVLSQLAHMKLVWIDQDSGHYFPYPTEPWCLWQEVKALNEQYKGRRSNDE